MRSWKTSLNRTPPSLFAVAAALTLGGYGCSSDPAQTTAGAGGGDPSGAGGGSSASSAASGSGGSSLTCPGPGYKEAPMPRLVDSLEATLVDYNGNPLPDLAVQLCGLDICLNGTTNATGQVTVNAAAKMMDKPAFKYADAIHYARFAVLLPPESVVVYPTPLPVAKFPDLAMGVPLVAGQSITSGDVTITIAAGTEVEIDTLLYDDPAEQGFRSVTIPSDKTPPAVDPALMLELVFAVTPLDTLFCPAAAVSVPNSLGWPAGTDVEFFVHGLTIFEEWAPYAGWAKASDGKVSADGTKIETVSGGGFHILSNFGVRRK